MLKQITVRLNEYITKIRSYPKKYILGGSTIVAIVMLLTVYLWPRTIELSYAGESCISQPTIAPGLLRSVGSDDFALHSDAYSPLVSGKLCVTAITPPEPGDHTVYLSLFGLPINKKVTIVVSERPVLATATLKQPVAVSKPLQLALSQPDTLHEYRLAANNKTATCKTDALTVRCDIAKLNLAQGAQYPVAVEQYFKGKRAATVAKVEVKTLSAVTIRSTSIQPNETIFAKPRNIDVAFDKPITSARAKLQKSSEPSRQIEVVVDMTPQGVTIKWSDDLERMSDYALIIESIEARDGSTLIEPYTVPFKMSGGPKVTGVNVPKTGVKIGTTAVISFDQPLSEKQDINKMVALTGGATVAGKQGNQLRINLGGVPKCGDFSIKLTADLQSNFEVSGQSAWNFAGRMLCYTTGSIGISSRGRPITAYYFGSGPTSIVYTGAIHGSEASTRALMLRWIDELEANARSIPADKSIVVVPTINPDGIATSSRTNGNNVDLNRNFATSDWKTDITTVNNTPFPKGGGLTPMSEPETKAIAGLVSRLRPRLVLSYHSIGNVLAANQTGPSVTYARTYAGLSGYSNVTGSSTTFEYAVSGTADDYYAEKLGVASIVIELGSHSYHQFERNQKAMWAMMR